MNAANSYESIDPPSFLRFLRENAMSDIHWPEKYLPGRTDNFVSNEVIVAKAITNDKEISVNKFWKVAPWVSKVVVLLCTAIFVAISVQPLFNPAASAASQGIAFTSSLGLTIFRVSFAGFPLGCAGFLVYCLVSGRRTLTGLIFSALLLGFVLIVRIYGMEVDSSVQQSMPLVIAEIVLVAITLAGIVIENDFRSHTPRTASEANAAMPR